MKSFYLSCFFSLFSSLSFSVGDELPWYEGIEQVMIVPGFSNDEPVKMDSSHIKHITNQIKDFEDSYDGEAIPDDFDYDDNGRAYVYCSASPDSGGPWLTAGKMVEEIERKKEEIDGKKNYEERLKYQLMKFKVQSRLSYHEWVKTVESKPSYNESIYDKFYYDMMNPKKQVKKTEEALKHVQKLIQLYEKISYPDSFSKEDRSKLVYVHGFWVQGLNREYYFYTSKKIINDIDIGCGSGRPIPYRDGAFWHKFIYSDDGIRNLGIFKTD